MFYVKFCHYSSVACSGFGNICFQMIGLSKFKKEKKKRFVLYNNYLRLITFDF